MAWLAVDKDKNEFEYQNKPERRVGKTRWGEVAEWGFCILGTGYIRSLPSGTIEKLIGHKLTWLDEPFEINK